ncbi:MAG: N-glycosylase/DNA lyase, partial [Verrucomicrobiota bacterium]
GEADLEKWSALSDGDLRAKLCELPGVGAKVANCVMLFAYERLRAFPIDVWIERVLREKYFPRKRRVTADGLRAFVETHFGEHGGYAQQYLFHHARMSSRRSGSAGDSSTALRGASPERSRRGRNDKEGARTGAYPTRRKRSPGKALNRRAGAFSKIDRVKRSGL